MSCRSKEDKFVFAIHSYVLAQGYKVVAVGESADAPEGDTLWFDSLNRSTCSLLFQILLERRHVEEDAELFICFLEII